MKKYYLLFIILMLIGCNKSAIDNPDLNSYKLNGYVQKGPFVSSSSITIQELDEDLVSLGSSYQTTTNDDFGSFSLSSDFTSSFVEIICTGFYFNEVEGKLSDANLTLRTLADLSNSSNVNINILTTIETKRIRYLVNNETYSFTKAQQIAEQEVLAVFNISSDSILRFNQMDISTDGESNAVLIAISSILQENNSVAELSELISQISIDLESDGKIDNESIKNEIKNNSINLALDSIRSNLEERYSKLGKEITIPNFEDYIDSDGDGILNMYEPVIKFNKINNANTNTTYYSNSILIKLLPDQTEDLATINNGSLIINGIDIGDSSYYVSKGDSVQIKLQTKNDYNDSITSEMIIGNNSGKYTIITKASPCINWRQASSSAEWSARRKYCSVVFNDKIWVLGGGNTGLNDVWNSDDGINWNLVTDSAEWNPRTGHSCVVFENKIWIFGGYNGNVYNDVWNSTDGISWNLVTDSANWEPRCDHNTVVFDNKIWLIGGGSDPGTINYKDIWYSTDGIQWNKALENTNLIPTYPFTSLVYNNSIYVMGDYGLTNQIWKSPNGIDWVQLSNYPKWQGDRLGLASVVYDNHMWIFGGYNKNDVWYSSDGINWKCANSAADWIGRSYFESIVFNDKIWIMGGSSTFGGSYNDVWYSE